MFYDHEEAQAWLQAWGSRLETLSLPKWEALPDLPLYMDQVVLLLGQYLNPSGEENRITASIVNNYVRMKVMPAPVKKKYTRVHLAYLLMICTLKQSLSIACIQKLLPLDITEDQVRLLYNDFVQRYQDIARHCAQQMRTCAPPLFGMAADDGINSIGSMAVGAALLSNLARDLTEQIILLQKPQESKSPSKKG